MLFISISQPKIPQRLAAHIHGIELRLDLFPQLDLKQIQILIKNSPLPILFTLRKKSHGGNFQGLESLREQWIEKLLTLRPPFFDLEYDMREEFLKKILEKFPQTQFILSYHNFQKTPENLSEIFHEMQRFHNVKYKIAALCLSTNDTLKMTLFSKNKPELSVICMGEKGAPGRILGSFMNNFIDYTVLNDSEKTAPGQISAIDLFEIYRYHLLNPTTEIYGLIGEPIQNSQGHIYHNQFFHKNQMNAVYIKMDVSSNELTAFFALAKKIPLKALSITMPLKEKIIPFIDQIDPRCASIGAVNTLLFREGQIFGTNTDGVGALDAIENKELVANKKIVILGAGGGARAIAFEAKQRKAIVTILNRTVSKAKELAIAIKGRWGSFEEIPNDYDILIQCTPHPMPINPLKILSKALIMDTVYIPKETLFLQQAIQIGCRVVYGDEMFYNQAKAQQVFWSN